MHIPTLLTLLPATLVLATPLQPRQDAAPVLKVTDFFAFHADPYIEGTKSNLSFHVSDTRPGLELEIDCVIPPTYFNLYAISALFDRCGKRELDVMYRYGETGLTVRRGWAVNATSYVQGTGTQSGNWNGEGEGKNLTILDNGKLYHRKEEWLFPLTVRAATPP